MVFVKTIFRYIVTLALFGLIGVGINDYLTNFDQNECGMTFMFQGPSLIPVDLPDNIDAKFPNYKLYLYCEGDECQQFESLDFHNRHGNIPVLFITGNADSHLQVRSIASVLIDKARRRPGIKYQFFTISFNEELTALYGPLLRSQTEYVRHSIEHILKLFSGLPESKRPKSVLLVGNSMGGLVARGVVSKLDDNDQFYKKKLVHTIISQAAPQNRPVISIDHEMKDYYDRVNKFWLNKSEESLKNIVLVSTYGGTRDVLVRSGLANINKWKSRSPAAIISVYTGSIPYVWKSIDHRCMAWCRELMLVLSRALIDLVDRRTGQIAEGRYEREKILKYRLVKESKFDALDATVIHPTFNLTAAVVEVIQERSKINFDFNGFSAEKKIVVFSLEDLIDDKNYDSVFIYSNFEHKNSFYLCKQFNKIEGELGLDDKYECTDPKDLFYYYGRSVPPTSSGFSIMNINDLQGVMLDEDYSHLVVRLPFVPESVNRHQSFVKFDWYHRRDRVRILDLPTVFSQQTVIQTVPGVSFQRYYLPSLQNVLEAYEVKKISYTQCDMYLTMLTTANLPEEQKNINFTNFLVEFIEPVSAEQKKFNSEHVFQLPMLQLLPRGLELKLTKNQRLVEDSIPYLDLIQFDPKNLVHVTVDQNFLNELSAQCQVPQELKIEISYNSILGQYVRFFIVFVPAFVAMLVQLYDYLILNSDQHLSGFLFLNQPQLRIVWHVRFSLFIGLLCFLLQSNLFNTYMNLIDPVRAYFPLNDFQLLESELIYNNFIPILLYWSAFAILSVATTFLSIIVNLFSKIINKLIFKLFKFLDNALVHRLLGGLHFVLTLCGGYFASALANVSIFYGETIKLATFYSIHSRDFENKFKNSITVCLQQTRVLLVYLLLVLNIPSIIVWTKSLKADEISTLDELKGDNGILVAVLNVTLYLVNLLKANSKLVETHFRLPKGLLVKLIIFNSILTVLYSTVNLYRLKYFILMHLFLMCFYSTSSSKNVEKPKNE